MSTQQLHFVTQCLIREIGNGLNDKKKYPFPPETREYFDRALKILPTLEGKEGLQETYLLKGQYQLAARPIDTGSYYFPDHINALSSEVRECVKRAGKELALLDWTGKSTNEQMDVQIQNTVEDMHFKFAQSSLVDLETPLECRNGEGSIQATKDRVHEFMKGANRPYSELHCQGKKKTDEGVKRHIQDEGRARYLENARLEFEIMLKLKTVDQLNWIRDPENSEQRITWDIMSARKTLKALDPTGQSTDEQMKERLTTERKRLEGLVEQKQSAERALLLAALPDRTHAKTSLLSAAAVA